MIKLRKENVSKTPEDLYYASSHEWLKLGDDEIATVGISDFAQSELGDVVYVELPEKGSTVSAKDEVSVVESVKTATDIYSPVSGEIIEVNDSLDDSPESVNSGPYEDGWLYKIKLSKETELDELLSAEDYIENCENS
jgi:glycine cleavage system H protein